MRYLLISEITHPTRLSVSFENGDIVGQHILNENEFALFIYAKVPGMIPMGVLQRDRLKSTRFPVDGINGDPVEIPNGCV